MANTDKNIVITPNIGSSSDDPKIVFSGADGSTAAQNITLYAYPTNNGTLSFEGSAGQLFSITNDLTGTIFSVADISGIPSLEVDADGTVRIAEYSGNVLLGTATDNGTDLLQVDGSISAHSIAANVNWSYVQSKPDPTLTLSGEVTGSATFTDLGNATLTTTIAANVVGANELNVSGNGTTSQYLRSDGDGTFTWATPTDTNTTYSAGNGISLSGTTFSVAAGTGLSQEASGLALATAGAGAGLYGSTANGTKIDTITIDAYGRVTAVATGTTGSVTSVATGTGLTGGTITSSGTISLSHLGIQNLTDPNADRIMFWDDSAGAMAWLTAGEGLTITGTTIAAAGGGGLFEETSTGIWASPSITTATLNGDLVVTGDVQSNSDERLKDNIETIDSAMSKVNSMRGVYYDKDDSRHVGLIAQEVEKVLPEVVKTAIDEMGTKSIAYGNIVGLLIEALKEQDQKIEDLIQEVNALKNV